MLSDPKGTQAQGREEVPESGKEKPIELNTPRGRMSVVNADGSVSNQLPEVVVSSNNSGQQTNTDNTPALGELRTLEDGSQEKYTHNGWERAFEAENLNVSEELLNHIKREEGLGPNVRVVNGQELIFPYLDPVDIPTVGYGLVISSLNDPKYKNGITRAQADTLLREKVSQVYEGRVERNVNVPLTQNEFDTLVGSVYNGGARSAVWGIVNESNYDVEDVFSAFLDTRTGQGGGELPGLIKRRAIEAWTYLYGEPPTLRNSRVNYEACTKNGVRTKTKNINATQIFINRWNDFADRVRPKPNRTQIRNYRE